MVPVQVLFIWSRCQDATFATPLQSTQQAVILIIRDCEFKPNNIYTKLSTVYTVYNTLAWSGRGVVPACGLRGRQYGPCTASPSGITFTA